MKRSISMLLAILTLAGTLTLPSMAAEPDEEKGTAQEAVQEEESAQADGTEAEESEPEPEPDPEGTVTWGNLDDSIRAESLNARILIENITGIEDIDYDQMYEDLRRQLNDIAQAQWMMILMGAGQAADALDQSYDSLRDVFDSIKDGELQADNADVVWQLEDTVNQTPSTRWCPGARTCTSPWWAWSSRPPTASGGWTPSTATWSSCACESSWARCPSRR